MRKKHTGGRVAKSRQDGEATPLHAKIPYELYKRFKIAVIESGEKTMAESLIEALEAWLKATKTKKARHKNA